MKASALLLPGKRGRKKRTLRHGLKANTEVLAYKRSLRSICRRMNSDVLTDVMVDELLIELGLAESIMDFTSPKKGAWTPSEDNQLLQTLASASIVGTNWNTVALGVRGRNGKQVRERYVNRLNPNLKMEIKDFVNKGGGTCKITIKTNCLPTT